MKTNLERLRALINSIDPVTTGQANSFDRKVTDIIKSFPVASKYFATAPTDLVKFRNQISNDYVHRKSQAEYSRSTKINGLSHEREMLKKAYLKDDESAIRLWETKIAESEKRINNQFEQDLLLAEGSALTSANRLVADFEGTLVSNQVKQISQEEQRLKNMDTNSLLRELISRTKK